MEESFARFLVGKEFFSWDGHSPISWDGCSSIKIPNNLLQKSEEETLAFIHYALGDSTEVGNEQ